jgi:hypothetical protein
MKRFLVWEFERGSIHYDVICGVILAFILATPRWVFNDRPDFMRVALTDPTVRQSRDDDGNTVFTVKLRTAAFSSDEINRQAAITSLSEALKMPVQPSKMEQVYDTTGALVAYSIWLERQLEQ